MEMNFSGRTFRKKLNCNANNTSIYLKWVSTSTGSVREGWEGMSKEETLSTSDEWIGSALDGVH